MNIFNRFTDYFHLRREARISKRVMYAFIVFVVLISFIFGYTLAKNQMLPAALSVVDTGSIGQRVTGFGTALTVHSVRADVTGAGPITPRSGYKFVIADVTIENLTDQAFDFAPFLHFHVRDGENRVHSVAVVPSADEQWSGKFLAHDMLREEIGFEVPVGAKDLRLYYEPGIGKQGILVVPLSQ